MSYVFWLERSSPFRLVVKRQGRVVGHILRRGPSLYFYRPRDEPEGMSYPTLDAVKEAMLRGEA